MRQQPRAASLELRESANFRCPRVAGHCGSLPDNPDQGTRDQPETRQMSSKRAHETEDLHFRVLKILQDNPDLSQRDLAARLGVSNGKLNYCLRALIDKGLVKFGNFAQSKHHLGYAYLLTPAGMARKAALTHSFLKRKLAEYEALKVEIASLANLISTENDAPRAHESAPGAAAPPRGVVAPGARTAPHPEVQPAPPLKPL